MTGLTEDMAVVLEPLRKMAERLSAGERALVEHTCKEVLGICEDEERETAVLVEEFNKLQDEMEDK